MVRLISLVIVVLIILSAVGGIWYWWPKYQEFKELKLKIDRVEKELQRKEDYFTELRVTAERLQGYSEEIEKINFALPNRPDVLSLFNFFEKVVADNGLILESISLSGINPNNRNPEIQDISFSASLSADYDSFKSFISRMLENSARLIEINRISFVSPEEEFDFIDFGLTMTTQFYKETKENK